VIITTTLKEFPHAPYHRADVCKWFGFKNTVYFFLEPSEKWVMGNHYPVKFADARMAARLTERLNFYLSLKVPYDSTANVDYI
jgi:hypothetical protein